MKSKWRILGLGLFVALVSVVGLPGAVKSQSKEIIDGARKEGKVLLYTALTIHEIDEIAGPFGKKIPICKGGVLSRQCPTAASENRDGGPRWQGASGRGSI